MDRSIDDRADEFARAAMAAGPCPVCNVAGPCHCGGTPQPMKDCPECDGRGWERGQACCERPQGFECCGQPIEVELTCPECNGRGEVLATPPLPRMVITFQTDEGAGAAIRALWESGQAARDAGEAIASNFVRLAMPGIARDVRTEALRAQAKRKGRSGWRRAYIPRPFDPEPARERPSP